MIATATDRHGLLSENAPEDWLDQLLKMSAAARELPGARQAKSIHPSALVRMIRAGKLKAVKCGRTLMTTRRWLRDMLQAEIDDYRSHRGIGATAKIRSAAAGDCAADEATKRLRNGTQK